MWSEYDEVMYVERREAKGLDPYPEETEKRRHTALKVAHAELLQKYNNIVDNNQQYEELKKLYIDLVKKYYGNSQNDHAISMIQSVKDNDELLKLVVKNCIREYPVPTIKALLSINKIHIIGQNDFFA